MKKTTEPATIAAASKNNPSPTLPPEFVGHVEAKQMFGLNRSHLYQLKDKGLIRSVAIRNPGSMKGRRLFHVESIRAFLYAHIEEPNPLAGGKEEVAE